MTNATTGECVIVTRYRQNNLMLQVVNACYSHRLETGKRQNDNATCECVLVTRYGQNN